MRFHHLWQVCRLEVFHAKKVDEKTVMDHLKKQMSRKIQTVSIAPLQRIFSRAINIGEESEPASSPSSAPSQAHRTAIRPQLQRSPSVDLSKQLVEDSLADDSLIGSFSIPVGKIMNWKGVSKLQREHADGGAGEQADEQTGENCWVASYRAKGSRHYRHCMGEPLGVLEAGDQVEAKSGSSKKWYPAVVRDRVPADGESVRIEWLTDQAEHKVSQINQEPNRDNDIVKERSHIRTHVFARAEEAARAWDDAVDEGPDGQADLNFSGGASLVGLHVFDSAVSLAGDDGASVLGVQAGVPTLIRLNLKVVDHHMNYLEITLDRAMNIPKMDARLGLCDPYCILRIYMEAGHSVAASKPAYIFRSKVVKNTLAPRFDQTFRLAVPGVIVHDRRRAVIAQIEVWDWDRFDEDDHIGTTTIELTDFIRAAHACTLAIVDDDGAGDSDTERDAGGHAAEVDEASARESDEGLRDDATPRQLHSASRHQVTKTWFLSSGTWISKCQRTRVPNIASCLARHGYNGLFRPLPVCASQADDPCRETW
jgi:hypothetical protein